MGLRQDGRAASIARALNRFFTFLVLASITGLLLGMLGRFSWLLDLFSHFRLHYVGALCLSGLVLLGLRQWHSAALAVLAAVVAAIPAFDYIANAPPATSSPIFKAISFNVWFRNTDLRAAVEYLESSGADVVLLQEISQQRANSLAPMLKSFPHRYLEAADTSDTVLFSKWPLLQTSTERLSENGVSAVRAIIDWRGKPITVIGAHLHWPIGPRTAARRDAELAGLARLGQPLKNPLVMLGDFNITPWSPHFKKLTSAFGLKDCAVGHGLDVTWPSQLLPLGIRIDHCLASVHWQSVNAWTGPHLGSDHRPMGVELQMK